ncbi:MAG: hypothetical protein ABIW76_18685 [Fibrobacteria bacterium]
MIRMTFSVLALTMALASNQAMAQVARPSTYWFGKVMTTERSRQLYVGLNANMWVLYDLPQGVLYQAWKGGANGGSLKSASPSVSPGYWFNGDPHFPHLYVPAGTDYFRDKVGEFFASYTKPADINTYYTKWPKQPTDYKNWSVANGATEVAAQMRYRGYVVKGTALTLNYSLILADKSEITVSESPEYSEAGGKTSLVRTFDFSGIPTGHQVRMAHPGGAAAAWSVTSGTATLTSGVMTQTSNGQTVLTGSW